MSSGSYLLIVSSGHPQGPTRIRQHSQNFLHRRTHNSLCKQHARRSRNHHCAAENFYTTYRSRNRYQTLIPAYATAYAGSNGDTRVMLILAATGARVTLRPLCRRKRRRGTGRHHKRRTPKGLHKTLLNRVFEHLLKHFLKNLLDVSERTRNQASL